MGGKGGEDQEGTGQAIRADAPLASLYGAIPEERETLSSSRVSVQAGGLAERRAAFRALSFLTIRLPAGPF